MSASHSGKCRRERDVKGSHSELLLPWAHSPRLVITGGSALPESAASYSAVDLGGSSRVSLTLTPEASGSVSDQIRETLAAMESVLAKAEYRMTITSQTIFLRDPESLSECKQLLSEHYGSKLPVTNFVLQPPCSGAALALEAWAIGGKGVQIEHYSPHALAVSNDGVRWVSCAGINSDRSTAGVYAQTTEVLNQLREALGRAGSRFDQVVRTWFYLGGITQLEAETQRYVEFNRARTDFYKNVRFRCSLPVPNIPHGLYPASTGIGMRGDGVAVSCLALQTERKDAFLLPLENPQQTPAYAYPPKYSPQSPKFSRAKALILGNYVTAWVSGTASVVHSESRHPEDPQRQTEQTVDNMEQLLSSENFAFHGIPGAGAGLGDLANIRVYLKRPGDFPICKAICERRFGPVPAIYAVADICRPELLVEIEGVAFARSTLGNHGG